MCSRRFVKQLMSMYKTLCASNPRHSDYYLVSEGKRQSYFNGLMVVLQDLLQDHSTTLVHRKKKQETQSSETYCRAPQ